MDSDFWTTRLAAAKRQFNMQHHHQLSHSHISSQPNSQLDRFSVDDFEVEEEARPGFPCPYCYEEFDIASLCSHLEDDHPFESKATRRRRLRRVPIPNSQSLSLLGRELREAHLQVLLGGSGYRSNSATSSNSATDPFLSSLVLNFSASETDEISKSLMSSIEENSSESVASQRMWKSSFLSSLSCEEREKRMRQEAGRAVFVQDLLVTTLLADQ